MNGLDTVTENDQATRVSSSSLVAVAWALSFVQAFLDFGSRAAQISAIPAFAARKNEKAFVSLEPTFVLWIESQP